MPVCESGNTNGAPANTHKCCNKQDCKGAGWADIGFWCGGAALLPVVGIGILAVDAIWSATEGTKRECDEMRNRKDNCLKNNCETHQYTTDPSCRHCLPKAIKRHDKPNNDCKLVKPVYSPNRYCSYHGYTRAPPTSSYSAGSIHSAKGMASRWKDWCHKRKNDRRRKKKKYTYLGGTLGDIIKDDPGGGCNRRGMTKKATAYEVGTNGLYFQEADKIDIDPQPPQPIVSGRDKPDYVIAPNYNEGGSQTCRLGTQPFTQYGGGVSNYKCKKPAGFDTDAVDPPSTQSEIKPYTYWQEPCESKCDQVATYGMCGGIRGVNFTDNCEWKKCERFVGPAYSGSDGWDWGGQ